MSFFPLDRDILSSSIWAQASPECFKVWVYLLLRADARTGIVPDSDPAISMHCGVPLDEVEKILEYLQSPDPYSRSKEMNGRRVERNEDGLLRLVTYSKHRDKDHSTERVRKFRASRRPTKRSETEGNGVSHPLGTTDTDKDKDKDKETDLRTYVRSGDEEDRESEFAVWWDEDHRELRGSPAFWNVMRDTYAEWPWDVIDGTWNRLTLWFRENPKRLEGIRKRGLREFVQAKFRQDATKHLQTMGLRDGPPLATPLGKTADEILADEARKRRKELGVR